MEATEERVVEIQDLIRGGLTQKVSLADIDEARKSALLDQGYTQTGDTLEKSLPPLIPAEDLRLMLANIGISSRWSAIYTSNNGPHAAFLRVQLRSGFAGRRTPTLAYVEKIREAAASTLSRR